MPRITPSLRYHTPFTETELILAALKADESYVRDLARCELSDRELHALQDACDFLVRQLSTEVRLRRRRERDRRQAEASQS